MNPKKRRDPIPAYHLPPLVFQVVQVPRAVWGPAVWSLSWADLYAVAITRRDGIKVTTKDFVHPQAPYDTAWMRQGDQGQALLYHQNWIG